MVVVYGLKNCDTCRKALKWLAAEAVEHTFHDIRQDGLDGAVLDRWIAAAGWQPLLNRRSTSWRNLPDGETRDVDEAKARALMLSHPTLIKRPVIETGDDILVGFTPETRAALARHGT